MENTTEDKELLLNQWQTCVDMANSVSQRRDNIDYSSYGRKENEGNMRDINSKIMRQITESLYEQIVK